jgi:septal ring factor EnvC (AmiA/AmiB activator)
MRKGIEIETSSGTPVKAVEKGSVVYADEFAGYGKMVIVDHGERYYTIYGHLAEINKKNGDAVSRGEALGQAGLGGSAAHARVYFEMRKDGQSFDPLPWLGKR